MRGAWMPRGVGMTSMMRTLSLLTALALLAATTSPTRAGLPPTNRAAVKRRVTQHAGANSRQAPAISRVQYQAPGFQAPHPQTVGSQRPPLTGPLELEYDDGTRRLIEKPICPDCYGPCPPRKYCPRGWCVFRETGCQRIDYSRYVLNQERVDYKRTRIGAALHPEYERVCRDFWLRDGWPR